MDNANDIITFLMRLWREDGDTRLQKSSYFQSRRDTIRFKDFYDSTLLILSDKQLAQAWRFHRFTGFLHAHKSAITPESPISVYSVSRMRAMNYLNDKIDASGGLEKAQTPIEAANAMRLRRLKEKVDYLEEGNESVKAMYQATEMARASRRGLETYKGYRKESMFHKTILAELDSINRGNYHNKGDRGDFFTQRSLHDEAVQEYVSRLMTGTGKFVDAKGWEWIDEFVERADKTTTHMESVDAVADMYTEIVKRMEAPPSSQCNTLMRRISDTSSVMEASRNAERKYVKGKRRRKKGESKIEISDEPIDSDQEFSNSEIMDSSHYEKEAEQIAVFAKELRKIDKEADKTVDGALHTGRKGGKNMSKVDRQTGTGDFHGRMLGTDIVVNRLKTMLKKWKVGWKERLDDRGDDVDAEEFIIHRVRRNGRQKYFIDDKRLNQKSKIAILLDKSGSMSNIFDPFFKAVGAICESLEFIGTSFSLFTFSDSFRIIKLLNEPWDGIRKERFAGTSTGGGTPLYQSIEFIEELSKTEDYKHIVIVCDGEPSARDACVGKIKSLINKGVGVSLLAVDPGHRNRLAERDFFKKIQPTGRLRVIDDLSSLPTAFFELLDTSTF
jgi:hypothetical protein